MKLLFLRKTVQLVWILIKVNLISNNSLFINVLNVYYSSLSFILNKREYVNIDFLYLNEFIDLLDSSLLVFTNLSYVTKEGEAMIFQNSNFRTINYHLLLKHSLFFY